MERRELGRVKKLSRRGGGQDSRPGSEACAAGCNEATLTPRVQLLRATYLLTAENETACDPVREAQRLAFHMVSFRRRSYHRIQ